MTDGTARLDHVSVVGDRPAFEEAGFDVTPTEGAAHHGRILLDRSYLEVTRPAGAGGMLGSRGWFLRPEDPAAAAEALRAAGLAVKGPDTYRGEDGDWLDVITSPPDDSLLVLTRRLDKEVDEWPPPLDEPHPNGARRLSGLRLRLGDPEPILGFLAAIGVAGDDPNVLALPGRARLEIEVAPAGPDGVIAVLLERDDGTEFELPLEPLGV